MVKGPSYPTCQDFLTIAGERKGKDFLSELQITFNFDSD